MIPVMVLERLNSRVVARNAADDAETPSSVFLLVDVFVVFPLCASQGERSRRGESTSDSHDLIIFFTLSRKGNRAAGTTAQRREEEASGSTTLLYLSFFVSTSLGSSLLLLRLLFLSLYSLRRLLRDLIRCKRSGAIDAEEEAQFTQLARRGYLIIC